MAHTSSDGTPVVQLQWIGLHAAKRADELQPGDVTVWNGGGLGEVVSVERVSKCFLKFVLRTDDGKLWDRRLKADRYVGFSAKATARRAAERGL